MNVKLLRRIQKHILAEPNRYDQDITIERGEPGEDFYLDTRLPASVDERRTFGRCGTVGCIAGWAQLLGYKRPRREFSYTSARRALSISEKEASRLFAYTTGEPIENGDYAWPEAFRRAYHSAKTAAGRARVAVRRIDHFIKTRGAE